MFGIVHFESFLIASILLNITPGSDTMYILGRSLSQGKKAGIVSALGISTGCLVHTIFAAIGLSAIIARSDTAFNIIKYLGAVYLVYLGIQMILSRAKSMEVAIMEKDKLQKIYTSGILTNILNPKVALFFLAFLPQFVAEQHAGDPLPFLILCFSFIMTGTTWCLMLAVSAAAIAGKIKKNHGIQNWLNRVTGIIFISLGIKLALQSKS